MQLESTAAEPIHINAQAASGVAPLQWQLEDATGSATCAWLFGPESSIQGRRRSISVGDLEPSAHVVAASRLRRTFKPRIAIPTHVTVVSCATRSASAFRESLLTSNED